LVVLHPRPLGELTALRQNPWLDFRGPVSMGRERVERGMGNSFF